MKYLILIVITSLLLIMPSGCISNLKVDGISVGATRLKTNLGYAGEVDEWIPIVLLNLKFGEKPDEAIRMLDKRELGMDEDWIKKNKKNIKCCACGGTLETSRFINIVETEKLATWKCPVSGRVDIPDYEPRAVAIVCDECIQKGEKIRHCIEWEGSHYQVKYHEIENLEDVDKRVSQMKYYFGRKFRRRILLPEIENKNNSGGLGKVKIKSPKCQTSRLDLPVRDRQAGPPLGVKDMTTKNPEYFRLVKDGCFVGFKRIVTEYLPAGHNTWQLDQLEHDPEDIQKLSRPAMGIETLKREGINSNI